MHPKRFRILRAKYPMIMFGMAAALMALTMLVLFVLSRSYRNEFLQSERNIARQIGSNLEYRFREHEEYASILSVGVSDLIGGEGTTRAEEFQEYTSIRMLLTAYSERGMISKISLYVPDEKMYSTPRDLFYPLSDLEADPAGAEVLNPGIHWVAGRMVRADSYAESVPAVACVMTARMKSNYARIASSLFLSIRVSDLYDAVASEDRDPGSLFLIDSEGRYIVCRDESLLGQTAVDTGTLLTLRSGTEGSLKEGSRWLTFQQIRGTGWTIVLRSSQPGFFRPGAPRTLLVIALWFIAAASIVFASVMITRNATVRNAIHTMQSMLAGAEDPDSFHPKDPAPNPDFLPGSSRLDAEISTTVHTLSDTIEKRYQEKLEMVDYQMQSLQEQIKPHFLYNTLDMINWMILDGKTQESVHIIQSLSKYLRLSINRGAHVVTLEKEIELVQLYLDLFLTRQSVNCDIELDLDPDSMDCLLPRFTLQPIVENALLHGLLPSEREDRILSIRSWTEDGFLSIEVEDNGCGIAPEALSEIADPVSESSSGYGLRNVQKRLRLFGGENAGIEINSAPGVGTCVSLRLPVKQKPKGSPE